MDYDELVAKWHQEKLSCAPLVTDAGSATQVWDATVELRKSLTGNPTGIPGIVASWSHDLSVAAPLCLNTAAGNQVRSAVVDLLTRLNAAEPAQPQLPLPPAPLKAQPAPPALTSDKE